MQHYTRIRELGKGSFGKCYLVKNNGVDPPELCVIKQMDTSMMSAREHEEAVKEASLLKKMNFPNIVRFQEVFMTRRGRLCICMEYCDGGDLHHKIQKRNGVPLSEEEVKDGFIQLAFALRYVHQHHILHRDLKSQNIFLHQKDQLKLGDFGIAKILTATKDYAKTMVGTPYYLSPEIIEEQPYNFRSDIWSLGVVLYEMLTLRHPFDASSLHFLAVKILKGKYPPPQGYSRGMEDLVHAMLQRDPQERPLAIDIVRNALFEHTVPTVNARHDFGWDLTELVESRPPSKQSASPTSAFSEKHELPSADVMKSATTHATDPETQVHGSYNSECTANKSNGNGVRANEGRIPGGVDDSDDMCLFASIVGDHATRGSHHAHTDAEEESIREVSESMSGPAHVAALRMSSSFIAEEISEEEEADVYESDFESLSDGDDDKTEDTPLLVAGNKVSCLREYLRQRATEDQFEQAYTLVRTAPESGNLAEKVHQIFGSRTAQLFPLLQLLCFLEELQ